MQCDCAYLHPTRTHRKYGQFLVFGSYDGFRLLRFTYWVYHLSPGGGAGTKISSKLNFGAIVVFWWDCVYPVASNPYKSGNDNNLSEKVHRDSEFDCDNVAVSLFLLAPSLKPAGTGLWIYSMIAGTIAVRLGCVPDSDGQRFLGIFERILLLNGQCGVNNLHPSIWTAFKPKPTQAAIDSNRYALQIIV